MAQAFTALIMQSGAVMVVVSDYWINMQNLSLVFIMYLSNHPVSSYSDSDFTYYSVRLEYIDSMLLHGSKFVRLIFYNHTTIV